MRDYGIKYHIPLHLIVFPLQITYKLRDAHFRVFYIFQRRILYETT